MIKALAVAAVVCAVLLLTPALSYIVTAAGWVGVVSASAAAAWFTYVLGGLDLDALTYEQLDTPREQLDPSEAASLAAYRVILGKTRIAAYAALGLLQLGLWVGWLSWGLVSGLWAALLGCVSLIGLWVLIVNPTGARDTDSDSHAGGSSSFSFATRAELKAKRGPVLGCVLTVMPLTVWAWNVPAMAAVVATVATVLLVRVGVQPESRVSVRSAVAGMAVGAAGVFAVGGLAPLASVAAWTLAWRMYVWYDTAEDELEMLLLQLWWAYLGVTASIAVSPLLYLFISTQSVLLIVVAWVYGLVCLAVDFVPNRDSLDAEIVVADGDASAAGP